MPLAFRFISESILARIIGLFLIVCTAAVFLPLQHASFINYDDGLYITDNAHIKEGLCRSSIFWVFTNFYAANWHPMTLVSHMLDYQLYGMNPAGHHLINVIFHIGNILLLFLVLRTMTGAIWRSALVAFLFALHPLHVESVAWVSERKDVLSTFFMLLSLFAYSHYTQTGKAFKSYSVSVFLLFLGLLSKAMLVTFPFILLLMDYWPLRRYNAGSWRSIIRQLLRFILEKTPFFLLSIIFSIITYHAQHQAGAVSSITSMPIWVRLANAAIAYVQYMILTFWPQNLALFYPHPGQEVSHWLALKSALLLALITAVSIKYRENRPYLPVGWFWYLGSLVPVIGIVQVGIQAMADRYTYIPLIGLFISAAWSLPDLGRQRKILAVPILIILMTVVVMMTLETRRQVAYWADTKTIFARTDVVTDRNILAKLVVADQLAKKGEKEQAKRMFEEVLLLDPNNITAHHNYGISLIYWGDRAGGTSHLKEALRLQPTSVTVNNSLGLVMFWSGDNSKALQYFNKALEIKPDQPETHCNLALIAASEEKYVEASNGFREALRLKPDFAGARLTLAMILMKMGRKAEAQLNYERLLKDDPYTLVETHYQYGKNLAVLGRIDDAIVQYEYGLAIDPSNAQAHQFIASLFLKQKQYGDASRHYLESLYIQPKNADTYLGIGQILMDLGRLHAAEDRFREALSVDPQNSEAQDRLGVIEHRGGQQEKARVHFRSAVMADYKNADARYHLGQLFFQEGRFKEAAIHLHKALEINPAHIEAGKLLAQANANSPLTKKK